MDPFVAFWAIRLSDAEVDHAPWIRTVDTRRRVQRVVQDEDRVAWFTLHQRWPRPAVTLRVCNISARVTCQFQAKVGAAQAQRVNTIAHRPLWRHPLGRKPSPLLPEGNDKGRAHSERRGTRVASLGRLLLRDARTLHCYHVHLATDLARCN